MANPSLQIGNSNWAIKEDNLLGYSTAGTRFVPQPITMTRASAGTRVNSSGLVETVELLGSEEVVNGDFATDSDWNTSATGISIAGDKLSRDATATLSIVQSSSVITPSVTYKITFEIVDYTSGLLTPRFGYNGTGGTAVSGVGTYTQIITKVNQNVIELYGTAFIGSISNVSVKEYTANNLARVDYDGTASSLLVEPERTNLITYSEEIQATTNVTLSNTISPDGTLNGLKINETTSNSQHYGTSYESSVVSGTIYAVSFYIKKGTYDLVKVYTQSSRISASINITFSTESTSPSGSDFISGSNFMEDAGNGWYRVGFSATANSTGAVSIYLPIKDLSSYVGDISQYTEYWGTQIEEGSYATSYIPTDGSTVTRVQDQYSKTGISNLINSEEGVLFVEMAALANDGTNRYLSISSSTTPLDDYIYFRFMSTSNRVLCRTRVGGSTINTIEKAITDTTDYNKYAIKWKSGDYAFWINGIEVGTDTNSTIFGADVLNQIRFDFPVGSGTFPSKVKQLQVFKTALTDSELIALTT